MVLNLKSSSKLVVTGCVRNEINNKWFKNYWKALCCLLMIIIFTLKNHYCALVCIVIYQLNCPIILSLNRPLTHYWTFPLMCFDITNCNVDNEWFTDSVISHCNCLPFENCKIISLKPRCTYVCLFSKNKLRSRPAYDHMYGSLWALMCFWSVNCSVIF